jgi:hypothetical protein
MDPRYPSTWTPKRVMEVEAREQAASDALKARVRTEHVFPPIPDRSHDWRATFDDYEPGDPMGYGPTESAAINNLIEQAED